MAERNGEYRGGRESGGAGEGARWDARRDARTGSGRDTREGAARPSRARQSGARQSGARQTGVTRSRTARPSGQRPPERRAAEQRTADGQRAGAEQRAAAGQRAGAEQRRGSSGRRPVPAYRRTIDKWRRYGVVAFAAIMLVGGLVGWMFFARPTASAFEKRDLTPYPEFTAARFLDGSFFSDLSLWYADTYPLREPMVRANHLLENCFGISAGARMYGGNVQADELPPEGEQPTTPATAEVRQDVDPPTEQAMQEDIQGNIMNGLYVDGDRACSVYYFDDYAVTTYAAALNKAAERLEGTANVYSILIPNNSGATLDDEVLAKLGGSPQDQALDYFHSLMSTQVHVVETYDTLRAHRSEYTYFRTDHHWTQLGAYYVYLEYCKVAGIEPSDITTWEQHDYAPFLGSFYQELWLDAMAANPDTVHVYVPTGTNDMTYWDEYGGEFQWYVVADATDYDDNSKYMCYIAGDQRLSKIENPKVTDGSSCLLVKDSYGCAFAPLLVDNYQTVYIIDFRKFTDDIPEFVYANGIQDVIFLNNMTIAGTGTVAETLLGLCS